MLMRRLASTANKTISIKLKCKDKYIIQSAMIYPTSYIITSKPMEAAKPLVLQI
jgi:hypothetical protein